MYLKIFSTPLNPYYVKTRLSDEITLPLSISQMALCKESDCNNEKSTDVELTADKLEENEKADSLVLSFNGP